MAGAIFENFCIQETIKAIFNYGKNVNVFYIRTHNGLEVDMLIEAEKQIFPVEFKLTKSPNFTMGESIRRFRNLFSQLPVAPGRIISLCEENIPLSRDFSVQRFDDYLSWLKNI